MRFLLFFLFLFCGAARAEIALLLSDERPPVMAVARAITATAGERVEVYNLNGSRNRENEVVQAILASGRRQVAAVGLLAAQVARERLSARQVVFCQVLNFEEFDLVTPWMKGVSGIPSLTRQFAAWKLLDPAMRRIGVITGRQAKYMLQEAEAAARRNGMELVPIEVSSDRAVVFAAQELTERKIQGLWLAPDSTILSQRAILELMTFSAKNNLPVLAFAPALLKEGALLSATPDVSEIAALVLDRLRRSADAAGIVGDAIVPLAGARLIVNGSAAARFGLQITPRVKEVADVQ